MFSSCKHQEILYRGYISLKDLDLDKTTSHSFSDYEIIALSKEFRHANDGKPLVFEAKLEGGQLVLCANLARLQSTKEVGTNGK